MICTTTRADIDRGVSKLSSAKHHTTKSLHLIAAAKSKRRHSTSCATPPDLNFSYGGTLCMQCDVKLPVSVLRSHLRKEHVQPLDTNSMKMAASNVFTPTPRNASIHSTTPIRINEGALPEGHIPHLEGNAAIIRDNCRDVGGVETFHSHSPSSSPTLHHLSSILQYGSLSDLAPLVSTPHPEPTISDTFSMLSLNRTVRSTAPTAPNNVGNGTATFLRKPRMTKPYERPAASSPPPHTIQVARENRKQGRLHLDIRARRPGHMSFSTIDHLQYGEKRGYNLFEKMESWRQSGRIDDEEYFLAIDWIVGRQFRLLSLA